MSKYVKDLMIDGIQKVVGECREVVVVDVSKVDAVNANKMRIALRQKNIRLLSVKNAVARRALGEIGLSGVGSSLVGPSTLAFGGEDIVALARELTEWANKIKVLEIKGGGLGETPLSAPDVETLSKSPGRKEMLSQLVGLILSPGARVSGAVLGAGGKLAGQVKTLSERTE
ncbi:MULTISPECIES: 50S ribosomal protein L10 [unclassified Schlesneria]|uniref:50S ribosomal protein L10 n=1 Tax=Schlesneria TaxID=656899 RepID=UPI002F015D05